MSRILTTRGIHGVQTHGAYVDRYRQAIGNLRANGFADRLTTDTITRPVAARIDANRWLIDCDCGGACAAQPDWPDSRCFGCGRIYTNVVFPANRDAIEAVLEQQSYEPIRDWTPGETIDELRVRQDVLTTERTGRRVR
jgi:hypothetical protein